MRSNQSPGEGGIDKRITALGVVGFLGLAGIFFLLGLFCLGPMVKSYMASRSHAPQTVYSPPTHQRTVDQNQVQEEPPQPLDVEVTEQPPGQTPPEDQAQSSDEGVKQDENTLTITLPENGDSERASKPTEPEKPRPAAESAARASIPDRRDSHASPASDRIYRIQAGTFASKTNAETLRDDLRAKGYHPEIKAVQFQDRTLYRVQLGGYRTQDDTKGLVKDLSSDGYTPTVITEKAE